MVAEVGADLADLVAQADHVVEPAAGHGVQVPGRWSARSMPWCSRRTRTASGWRRGLGWLPALVTSTWPPVRWRSRASAIGERALLPVQVNSTRAARGRGAVARWGRIEAERRVQGGTGGGQRVGAALQVQVVVAVAGVEAAAAGGDQPAAAQQPQMVGDQVLRLADQIDQLTNPVVTRGQLGQQPPPQRVGGQPHEGRGGLIASTCRIIHQTDLMYSACVEDVCTRRGLRLAHWLP